ncbi:inositol 1,4,5-triphosphate receptor associated 2 isoform X2 [Amia ocellicauda]|uniref:inositol 1,4,5-triphosphate receptor associated 2 isoform X2 n=1 Tax=Amia ocellicauda TaxID=2972642 RepID=UPI003464766F
MASDIAASQRRHNPVDSICRKIQTIQRRDQETNSTFQIPKFQSRNYDSPHASLKKNMEAILKNRTVKSDGDSVFFASPGRPGMLTPKDSPGSRCPPNGRSPANTTYTTSGLTGKPRQARPWSQSCSTPTNQMGENYFSLSCLSNLSQTEGRGGYSFHKSESSVPSLGPYSLHLCHPSENLQCDLTYQALVVKRLSMGDGPGNLYSSESRKDTSEISLICEEDLLDTIFHACDTQRRGKVYVSRIVDYLRHTTSRGSEDSGLEELCNMLDPEHRDISIDLDTYHAIMKEWIDDCRNHGDETTAEDLMEDSQKLRDSLSARKPALMNMTAGSLEAFGGEVSRGDLETSDLVYCVADLQFNNQKLQDEVRKVKLAVETMEETNNKLMEENEDLRAQAKSGQQSAMKEKLLKEELEEMKANLSNVEESRARSVAQNKQMERENQSLVSKITSLQEENIKNTVDIDDLQKKIAELCKVNADLQIQMHSFDAIISAKEVLLCEKNAQIQELKTTIVEYSSVTELLRAEKSKLENHMEMLQPDLASGGMSLSVAYRLNQSISGSLQTELALAQQAPEVHGAERVSASPCHTPSLDETLDREVLLLLQGPAPEQMSAEFKTIIQKLHQDFREDIYTIMCILKGFIEANIGNETPSEKSFEKVQSELEEKRNMWIHSIELLDQYKCSMEKELIKMASNIRRSRTDMLHLKKELSVRLQELEGQKQLQQEADKLQERLQHKFREVASQTESQLPQIAESTALPWTEESSRRYKLGKAGTVSGSCGELCRVEAHQGTENTLTQKHKRQHPGLIDEEHIWWRFSRAGESDHNAVQGPHCMSVVHSCSYTQLFDALTLDLLHICPRLETQSSKRLGSVFRSIKQLFEPHPTVEKTLSKISSCETLSVGVQVEDVSTLFSMSDMKELPTLPVSSVTSDSDNQESVSVQEPDQVSPVLSDMSDGASQGENVKRSGGSALQIPAGEKSCTTENESVQDVNKTASLSTSFSDGILSPVTGNQGPCGVVPKKDTLTPRSKFKKHLELSRNMEAIKEHNAQEEQSESTDSSKKEAGTPTKNTEEQNDESVAVEKNIFSADEKAIESEFDRLSLGFKCDMFTLEKRLRLEQRSRDLAEENLKKEIDNCKALLENLVPLCEEDNQSMEIIQRLRDNLEVLVQSMTRVSSRSEMLGAIHQENRVGKAIEIMIQHVDNLKRMYRKEHDELLELKGTIVQNERSFGSYTDRDDLRSKKNSGSQYYKSARRVSIAAIPRNVGAAAHFEMPKLHEAAETEADKLTRRNSNWRLIGAKQNVARPTLQRFISSCAWAESDEPSLMKGYEQEMESTPPEEKKEEIVERRSSLTEMGNKISSVLTSTTCDQISSRLSDIRHLVSKSNKGLWISIVFTILFAALIGLIASFAFQPSVDAAPVGTGDSWMAIQQLLWPYTGLRHNGQPPV